VKTLLEIFGGEKNLIDTVKYKSRRLFGSKDDFFETKVARIKQGSSF